jgi:hypothetical protein
VHGGPVAAINAQLKALGMPPLAGGDLPANPFPTTRVVWNPQGFGDPGSIFDLETKPNSRTADRKCITPLEG